MNLKHHLLRTLVVAASTAAVAAVAVGATGSGGADAEMSVSHASAPSGLPTGK